MEESPEYFGYLMNDARLTNAISGYGSGKRRLEVLSAHALLHEMAGDDSLFVDHADSGRPIVAGWNISISHTTGFVCVIISKERVVAVDIERFDERVNRVAAHFLRPDEKASDLNSRLVCWCAKETLYKYSINQNLGFSDMRIDTTSILTRTGTVEAENLKQAVSHHIHYRIEDDYVLTYMF